MSRNRFEFSDLRGLAGALALAAAWVCGAAPARASDAHSSPQDRQRFVAIVHSLEQAPLKPALKADRAWALAWLTEAPDVAVTVCPQALRGLEQSRYAYAAEILLQDMFAMAAFAIEHPDQANDPAAQQLAGMEGALNAYRAILGARPRAKSPALDSLLQTQAQGGLPASARDVWTRCSAQK